MGYFWLAQKNVIVLTFVILVRLFCDVYLLPPTVPYDTIVMITVMMMLVVDGCYSRWWYGGSEW